MEAFPPCSVALATCCTNSCGLHEQAGAIDALTHNAASSNSQSRSQLTLGAPGSLPRHGHLHLHAQTLKEEHKSDLGGGRLLPHH